VSYAAAVAALASSPRVAYAATLDEVENRVLVHHAPMVGPTEENLVLARLGRLPGVRLVEVSFYEQTSDCSRTDCRPNARAGLSIENETTDGAYRQTCTSGFSATNAQGSRYLITAGHCVDGAHWRHGGAFLGGTPNGGVFDQPRVRCPANGDVCFYVDVARIYLKQEDWTSHPDIYITQNNFRSVQRVGSRDHLVPGMGLCVSGQTSGYGCFEVVSGHHASVVDGREVQLYQILGRSFTAGQQTDCRTRPGDSGSAYFSGETARGIHSGRTLHSETIWRLCKGTHADVAEEFLELRISRAPQKAS
jgi:hypothetical protein